MNMHMNGKTPPGETFRLNNEDGRRANGNGNGRSVAILTERLRHEERLLLQAFTNAGACAKLVSPDNLALSLHAPALADRLVVARVPAS